MTAFNIWSWYERDLHKAVSAMTDKAKNIWQAKGTSLPATLDEVCHTKQQEDLSWPSWASTLRSLLVLTEFDKNTTPSWRLEELQVADRLSRCVLSCYESVAKSFSTQMSSTLWFWLHIEVFHCIAAVLWMTIYREPGFSITRLECVCSHADVVKV